tara:strand:- start:407 stop:916 length:510 start_codon:yes stop_codon:yes gene_type:complete
MIVPELKDLEQEASHAGFLLRLQVRRPLGLWSFKVVVAEILSTNKVKILGEMKGWAYRGSSGLQLDTMRVAQNAPSGTGHLIWTATMAWAIEETPCKKARLLAIFDDERQHGRLKSYFKRRGFSLVRDVQSSLVDLPLRMVWGGAGALMVGNCLEVLEKSYKLFCTTKD